MDIYQVKPFEAFSHNIFWFKVIATWTYTDSFVFKLHKLFIITIAPLVNIHEVIMVLTIDDFEDMVIPIVLILALFTANCKLYLFSSDKTIHLLNYFRHPLFQGRNQYEIDNLKQNIVFGKYLTAAFLGSSFMTITLVSIYYYYIKKITMGLTLSDNLADYYDIFFILHNIALYIGTIANINLDSFIPTLHMNIATQCDILCERLENIDATQENACDTLKECSQHYKIIVQWSDEVNETYQNIILMQFACSCIIFCMCFYSLAFKELGLDYFLLVCFLFCCFWEPCLSCWFGNELFHKSDRISISAFNCNWYDGPQRFKKDLIFFIHFTQKPIIFLYAKLFPANMPTFITLLKASWSYYLMLVSVNDRDQ